jgi:hypothetical protein
VPVFVVAVGSGYRIVIAQAFTYGPAEHGREGSAGAVRGYAALILGDGG